MKCSNINASWPSVSPSTPAAGALRMQTCTMIQLLSICVATKGPVCTCHISSRARPFNLLRDCTQRVSGHTITLIHSGSHAGHMYYTPLHLMAVCKLVSDTTHICITAVTQLTQVCLSINVGGSTVCIHACVCALQEQNKTCEDSDSMVPRLVHEDLLVVSCEYKTLSS